MSDQTDPLPPDQRTVLHSAQRQPANVAPGLGMPQSGQGAAAQIRPGQMESGSQQMPDTVARQMATPRPVRAQGARPAETGGASGTHGQLMQPGAMAGGPGQAGRPPQRQAPDMPTIPNPPMELRRIHISELSDGPRVSPELIAFLRTCTSIPCLSRSKWPSSL
jgi:hypothetical protein